jgi:dephospho-CoA kinase
VTRWPPLHGLTGGTGSGKSQAAARFAELGFPVISADRLGHEAIAPGGEAEAAVIEAFGEAVVAEGRIDRGKLGRLVFRDREALERLNAIVHPAIHRLIARRLRELGEAGGEGVLLDAALLGEKGGKDPCLETLTLVLAAKELRVSRLMKARGWSVEEARARISMQTPPEKKLAFADQVIQNNGGLKQLNEQVDHVAQKLRARTSHPNL